MQKQQAIAAEEATRKQAGNHAPGARAAIKMVDRLEESWQQPVRKPKPTAEAMAERVHGLISPAVELCRHSGGTRVKRGRRCATIEPCTILFCAGRFACRAGSRWSDPRHFEARRGSQLSAILGVCPKEPRGVGHGRHVGPLDDGPADDVLVDAQLVVHGLEAHGVEHEVHLPNVGLR